jgi:DNA-binding LytR/AlgR family response regulator
MKLQTKKNEMTSGEYVLELPGSGGIEYSGNNFRGKSIAATLEKGDGFKYLFQQDLQQSLDELLARLLKPAGKKSFLVFKHNKYVTIPTDSIAFFYVRYESSVIVCFDQQEYPVNYSLEQIQQLLTGKQFFRLNRQYLINFLAIKEVEHYFARKLLVKLAVSVGDKLLVSKEKVSQFLHWLENR